MPPKKKTNRLARVARGVASAIGRIQGPPRIPRSLVAMAPQAIAASKRFSGMVNTNNMRAMANSVIDNASVKYLNLLRDPCGGDLVPAPYPGAGSGILFRTRQIKELCSTATPIAPKDFLIEVQPSGAIAGSSATAFVLALSGAAGANLPGSAPTNALDYPSILANGVFQAFRPVAGCVELMYMGTELNRGGSIFSSLIEAPSLSMSAGTPVVPISNWSSSENRCARLGDEAHRIRFAPGVNDQLWTQMTGGVATGQSCPFGNILQMSGLGITGPVQITVTFVWEVVILGAGGTGVGAASSGLVNSIQTPAPSKPMNVILSGLGRLAHWATAAETAIGIAGRVAAMAA